MQRTEGKYWKCETKTTCKEQMKLITSLISSGDNSKINGNTTPVFSPWMAKYFWLCISLPEVHCSLVLLIAMWDQMRCGHDLDMNSVLIPRGGSMKPLARLSAWSWRKQAPGIQHLAQDAFWKHRLLSALLPPCLSLPVCKWRGLSAPLGIMKYKEYRDHALATFKPLLSLLSDEHLCLLFSPWALHILLATTFALRLCQLNMKREVAMASA